MPLFMNRPPNVEVIGINTKGAEKRAYRVVEIYLGIVEIRF